jgi:hypothetical protein
MVFILAEIFLQEAENLWELIDGWLGTALNPKLTQLKWLMSNLSIREAIA